MINSSPLDWHGKYPYTACGLSQLSLSAALVICSRRASNSFFSFSHSAPCEFFAPHERRYNSLRLRRFNTTSSGISLTIRCPHLSGGLIGCGWTEERVAVVLRYSGV